MFAVSGLQMDLPEGDRNVLHFLNAEGERLQSIRLASGNFAGIAWESSGLRVGALIDTNIFLVVIKFPYKWAYCGQTLVYCYRSLDEDEVLVFFETRMEIKTKRYLQNTCCIRGIGDQCLVVFRSNELRGAVRQQLRLGCLFSHIKYTLQLCDSIGTPMDQQSTSLAPDFVAVAQGVVAVATWDSFTVWQYDTTRKAAPTIIGALALDQTRIESVSGAASQRVPTRAANNGKVFYIDQPSADGPLSNASLTGKTTDLICAIACSPSLLLVVSE